jgi:hypothetical protein
VVVVVVVASMAGCFPVESDVYGSMCGSRRIGGGCTGPLLLFDQKEIGPVLSFCVFARDRAFMLIGVHDYRFFLG